MKFFLLRLWVMARRLRRGAMLRPDSRVQQATQVEALLRRANPFACWNERANWMIDLAEWLRQPATGGVLENSTGKRDSHRRLLHLLDWLEVHRDARRLVQATLQKTLREATGPELFCATGLPREPAFFGELIERVIKLVLPKPPAQHDLSALFTAMFPEPVDADWLLGLDHITLSRVAKLCTDDGIRHSYIQQIDEALTYLVTMVVSVGISPAFRQRLGPKVPLQATPFMALRREMEKYCMDASHDPSGLRSVRMLIAVCQAQTDRIYEHLDEYGVSVGLVYSIERMRAQLMRMARLIDLRVVTLHTPQGASQIQALLADLIAAHHARGSVPRLVHRSFSLLARKMVERNASHGEQYIARNAREYRAMFNAACIGGLITALTVLGKFVLADAGLARFFEGAFASLNYAVSFLLISALGGVLATKQPAVTAPALAARMGDLNSTDGLRGLLLEIALLLRSQAAAVFGNLIAVVPAMALLAIAVFQLSGAPVMSLEKAHATQQSLSLFGVTPLFAALTGVLLWLSSLAAGFADNWFALRQLRAALTHHRRLVHALGTARAERLAHWAERHVAGIAGNLSLAVLLGMGPVVMQFFGLPLDVRHVTLSTGALVAAVGSIGWGALATPEFWRAAGGIVLIGVLNVGVAFGCALALALRAREVTARVRRLVFRSVLRRISSAPRSFLFPQKQDASLSVVDVDGNGNGIGIGNHSRQRLPEREKRAKSAR